MADGQRLRGGRYVLRGVLGEGSQGTTYDGVDLREGRAVAIKRFDVRGARHWKDVELAEREARVLASLNHPLLPKYKGHFEEDGALYLVMEKIEGETLDSMRHRLGAVPEAEIINFLGCAADALGYLHGRSPPVVHRDLKPRNVIRRPDGTFAFVDFGSVAERMKVRGGSTVVGTMGYMAPEQFQGRALPATDVYAVGATALSVLAGADPETLPHRGLRINVRAALGNRVSGELVATLEQMLDPDPDVRARSIAPLLHRFGAARMREAARRPRVDVRSKQSRSANRHRQETELTDEDRRVKSIRKLLWLLWALGWPIVAPISHGPPTIMFIWLALIIVLTWHRGAALRLILREIDLAREHRLRIARSEADANPHVRVTPPSRVAQEPLAHDQARVADLDSHEREEDALNAEERQRQSRR